MKQKCKKSIALILAAAMLCAMLTGCRPSTAMTRMADAFNALNLGNVQAKTSQEEEQDIPDDDDPINEKSEEAKIEEEMISVGELFGSEAEAEKALLSIYSELSEDDTWGAQYITDGSDAENYGESLFGDPVGTGGDGSNGKLFVSSVDGTAPTASATVGDGLIPQDVNSVNASDDPDSEVGSEVATGDALKGKSETAGGENSSDGESGSGADTGGAGESSSVEPSGGDKDAPRESIDENGDYIEPEEAGHGGVAATGELALAVCMLAGSDRLCATNEDFAYDSLSQEAFGIESDCVYWSGDGLSPMSSEDFDALMEQDPDMIIELDGSNTFSTSQINRYKKEHPNGYHTLPGFDSVKDTETTMTVLAAYLGDTSAEGGKNAPQVAQNYLDWCETYRSALSNIKTEIEVVYIEGWDDNVTINYVTEDGIYSQLSNDGMAYIRPGTTFRPLSTYLGYANVTDFASAPTSETMMGFSRVQWKDNTSFSGSTKSGDYCCVTPLCQYLYLDEGYCPIGDGGSLYIDNMSAGVTELTLYGYTVFGISRSASLNSMADLGADDSNFQIVLAKDQATANAVKSSWQWVWNPDNYLHVYGDGGGGAGHGWVHLEYSPIGNVPVASNILGNYSVDVQVSGGIGDWVNGSPEGILESIWAAYEFQRYYTKSQMEAAIKDFYKTFYGYTLTSDDLNNILKAN